MHPPSQAQPVSRSRLQVPLRQGAPSHDDAPGLVDSCMPSVGIHPSGYEDCYSLTGPAQDICLMVST